MSNVGHPSLEGVVELDYRSALAGMRTFRREMRDASRDSLNFNGQKAERQLKGILGLVRQIRREAGQPIIIGGVSGSGGTGGALAQQKLALQQQNAQQKLALQERLANQRQADERQLGQERIASQERLAERRRGDAAILGQDRIASQERLGQQRNADAARTGQERIASQERIAGQRLANQRELAEQRAFLARRNAAWSAAGLLGNKAANGAGTVGGVSMLALGLATSAAISFEDSFADVRKTVEGTPAELDKVSASLRKMARDDVPVLIRELDDVASNAGQLGIKSKDIVEFTRTVADLSASTKLTSDEASSDMAKFANIMQTPQEEFRRLGSTWARLGNIGASTEREIMDMGLRIAGAGKQLHMTEAEVLGTANALSSLGILAESGGTAFSTSLIEISKSSAQGQKDLKLFAAVAGMAEKDFKKLFDKRASEGITRFVEGLGKLDKGDLYTVLDELGLKSKRVTDTLSRAAGAGDLMRESIAEGTKAWRENTALTTMAEARYKTHASQIKLTRNRVYDLAITVGENLLPVEENLLSVVNDLTEGFADLSPETQKQVTYMTLFGGATLLAVKPIKGLIDMAVLARRALLGMRAAQLASAGTAGAGGIGAGAGAGAAGAGLALPVVTIGAAAATEAVGLLSIAYQKNVQHAEELRGANLGLAESAQQVEEGYTALSQVENILEAFRETYGDIRQDIMRNPLAQLAHWEAEQIELSYKSILQGARDLKNGVKSAFSELWYELSGGYESGINRFMRRAADDITGFNGRIIQGIKDEWTNFIRWTQGQTANIGDEGPSLPAIPGGISGHRDANGRRTDRFEYGPPVASAAQRAAARRERDAQTAAENRASSARVASVIKETNAEKERKKAKTESDKTERALLKSQKDALADTAKGYDLQARAAERAANAVEDGAKRQVAALEKTRAGFKSILGNLQEEFVRLGIINNPLGGLVGGLGSALNYGGRSQGIVSGAYGQWRNFQNQERDARRSANSTRSESELLSGLDGVVPGGASGKSTVAAARAMVGLTGQSARATGKAYGLEWCVGFVQQVNKQVTGKTLAGGTLKVKDLRAWGMAAGLAYTGTPHVGDYMTRMVGGERHAAVVSAVNRAKGTFSTIGGNEGNKNNYASRVKEGAVYKIGGKGLVFIRSGANGEAVAEPLQNVRATKSGGSSASASEGTATFDIAALSGSLSSYQSIPRSWGAPVKSSDNTQARFAFQSAIARGEFNDQLGDIGAALRLSRSGPKGIGPFANGNLYNTRLGLGKLAQQGVVPQWQKGWTQRDQDLDFARQIANLSDRVLNNSKSRSEAEDKTSAALKQQIADVQAARKSLLAMETAGASESALSSKELAYRRAHPNDEASLSEYLDRQKEIDRLRALPELQTLTKSGRIAEADAQYISLLNHFDAEQKARKEITELTKKQADAAAAASAAADEGAAKWERLNSEAGNNSVETFKNLKAALTDTNLTADELQKTLEAIPFGMEGIEGIAEKVAAIRAKIPGLRASEAAASRSELLSPYQTQNADLRRQMAESYASFSRPMSSLMSQNLDWAVGDEAHARDVKAGRAKEYTKDETDAINTEREAIRGLLGEWDIWSRKRETAMSVLGSIESGFDSTWRNILSGEKSWGEAMSDGLKGILTDLSGQIIQSQINGWLTGLVGGFLGVPSVSPSAAGSFGGGGVNLRGGGSFATGSDYIPRDGLYMLHKSEAVVPASQNRALQKMLTSGSSGGGGTTVVNVTNVHNGNIVANDPLEYERKRDARMNRGGNRAPVSPREQRRGGKLQLLAGRT